MKNETLKKEALAIKERLDQAWSASAYYLLICMGCGILGMVLMIGIHQQYDSVSKLAEWLWFFNQPLRTKKIFLVVFTPLLIMIFGAFLALAWGEIFRLFDIPKCSGHFQVFRLNKNTIVGNISGHWLDVTDYSWGPGVSPLEIIPNPSDFIVRDGMLSYPLDSTEAIQALRGWLEKSKTLLARPPKKWQYWTYYALPLPLILLYIGAIIYFAH